MIGLDSTIPWPQTYKLRYNTKVSHFRLVSNRTISYFTA